MKNKSKNHDTARGDSEETNAAANEPANTEEAIAVEAYHLWQAAGSPEGRDEEFWLAAARNLGNLERS